MTVAIEELLNILCPGATPGRSTEFQKAWVIPDAIGAKLAYEVLTAHGFEAKLYPHANSSKLYVGLSPEDAALEQKFAAAIKHAGTLVAIRQNLGNDSSMTFVNTPAGKQIVIQLAGNESELPHASAPAAVPISNIEAVKPAAPIAAKPPAAKKAKKPEDLFKASGPAVGKGDLFAGKRQDGIMRQFYLYARGNVATAVVMLFLLVVVPTIIAFSLFSMTKSFFCADFAVAKTQQNHAWYCGDSNAP